MLFHTAATTGVDSGMFWAQLPLLVLAVAVTIVAITALWRARPEDVPRIFEVFAAAFGRRQVGLPQRRESREAAGEPNPEEESE